MNRVYLDEYIEILKRIQKGHKQSHELKLIYSVDDEGNDYKIAVYPPTLVMFNSEEGEIKTLQDCEGDGIDFKPNAILLN